MSAPRNSCICRLPGVVLAVGLALLPVVPRAPAAEELSREQQIAELERQIRALTARLETLRKAPAPRPSPPASTLPADWVKALPWRSIGPASMGGRIVAVAVNPQDASTWWVATASGGLLKTTNNGVTFVHQLDREATVSIGAVCCAPSNPNIVWVGTGENNPRNSVSYGDGVYKSTDGGKSWKCMGLKDSFQIGRIAIHPTNPDVVYVGALGRLYGPNPERGLFKTTDGGQTWQKILFVDDRTGVIDLRMHPTDPDTLLVATWERRRDEFDSHRGEPALADGYDAYDPSRKWGPGSGLFRTTDGGKTWQKITKGLPTSNLGRIGLDWYRKDPRVVFAIVDCEKIGMGTPPSPVFLGIQGEDAPQGARLTAITPGSPAARAGLQVGDVVQAVNKQNLAKPAPAGAYTRLAQAIGRSKPGDKVVLTVRRGKETKDFTATLARRPDLPAPGRNPRRIDFRGEDTRLGVRVTAVPPDSQAARAGLQKGDVIQMVEGRLVTGLRPLRDLLAARNPGDKVKLRVLRGKENRDITLTLGGAPGRSSTRPYSYWYGGQRENVQDQQGPDSYQYGGLYKSTDGGESWTRVNSVNPRPMYFSQVRVDPSDEKHLYVLGIALYRSQDGGKTFKPDGGNGVHPDQHALWIDPRDGRHMILGTDGGFYSTYDRMAHWDFHNQAAIGQFYHVVLDTRRPARAYGGLQDNGSWGGPTHALDGRGPVNADWVMVSGGDGFVCRVDATDPDLVYFESQDGHMGRYNLRTGERASIAPTAPKGAEPYRFNWNTPFILSHHNARIFYCAGNYVFRSFSKGDDLRVFSPEITRTKRGSGTALAESPRNPDVLWVGTDDGFLWVTRDGGKNWQNVTDHLWASPQQIAAAKGANGAAAAPAGGQRRYRWVASIEPSRFADGRAYVVLDGHRSNDDEPYVFATEDFGQTWRSLRANLPWGSTRVCREDLVNPDVLYLGTEFGAWVSLDRGGSWARLNGNLPTVAVHEFALNPTNGELVAATHGRSLWVLDVSALRQVTPATLKAKATLYRPSPAVRWRREPMRGVPYGAGSRVFVGHNPPAGAQIYYGLTKRASRIDLRIFDYAGRTVRVLEAKGDAGLHRVSWDLGRGTGRRRSLGRFNMVIPFSSAGLLGMLPQAFGALRGEQGPPPPGMYRVVLTVDGEEFSQGLRLEADPVRGDQNVAADEADAGEDEEREERGIGKGIDH